MIRDAHKWIPWVVGRLKKELFGISTEYVREMVRVTHVTGVPRMPSFVRGVINLRGNIIPLIDLRVMLGMQSGREETDELIENLMKREKDHRDWIDNLKRSVEEKTSFTGALDPHQCAFGRWYDTFKTDNLLLEAMLRRFDKPHKAIHGVGVKVKSLEEQGDFKGALALIEQTRHHELARMIELFATTRELLRAENREIAVVLTNGEKSIAVTVDAVESVEKMKEDSFAGPPLQNLTIGARFLCATSRRIKNDDLVFLLDTERMIFETSVSGAETTDAMADESAVPALTA